jgi:hypothetical protein
MSIFSRHTAYERLVTERVDGVLDTAGEARLQQHLATCESCVVEMREQQAVRSLLRAEALVPAPRSFALPYAPRQAAAGDSRVTAWLRSMQVATATAAVVLVALVGVSVVDQAGGGRAAEADAQQMASAIENADKLEAAAAAAPEPRAGPPVARSSDGTVPESITSGFVPDGPSTGGLAADSEDVGGGLPTPEDAPSLSSPPTQLLFAPDAAAAQADVADDERSVLAWALLAASVVTAVLALSVVAVTWRGRRPV